MKKISRLLLCFAVALVLGCSSPSEPGQSASGSKQQNQLETGRVALQKMIPQARFWSQDAQPIRLESEVLKDINGHDGKLGFWRAVFASPAKQKAETFTWSGMSGPDRGVSHGSEDSFTPTNRSTQPFDLNFLRVDTDKAFEVAQQHGGKQLLVKEPTLPMKYMLDWDAQANQLKWHVFYGGNDLSAKLTVVVNASTGEFMHKE